MNPQRIARVWAGKIIAPFTKKDLLRRSKMNELVACINPFLSAEIQPSSAGRVILSDAKVVFQIGPEDTAQSPPQTWGITFKLKTMHDDYLGCVIWDGTTEGVATNVAKPWLLRCSRTSRSILGVDHTFTYDAGATYGAMNVRRTNSWTGGTQDELVHPPWSVDDIITADLTTTGLSDDDGNALVWEMRPERNWAKIAT